MSTETRCKIKALWCIAILTVAEGQQLQKFARFKSSLGTDLIVQEQAKADAEQWDVIVASPKFDLQGQAKRAAKQIEALTANVSSQKQPKHLSEQMIAINADSKLRKLLHVAPSRRLRGSELSAGHRGTPRLQKQLNDFFSLSADPRQTNVKAMYIWVGLIGLFNGIALGPVFDKYVFELSGRRNSLVGAVESVNGLTGLCCALPFGYLVDQRPESRARLCQISFYLGILAAVAMASAVLLNRLVLVYGALVFLGVFYELASCATAALFADSIPQGNRAKMYTIQGIIQTVLLSVGPGVTALGFYAMGDNWGPSDMRLILSFGNCALLLASMSLLLFRDPLKDPSMFQPEMAKKHTSPRSLATDNRLRGRKACWVLRPPHVPIILGITSLITNTAAGMTVKLFNLWFINDMRFSGSEISWVQTVAPLVYAVLMNLMKLVSTRLGRAQTCLLAVSLRILMFVGLAKFKNVPLLLFMYFIRGGLYAGTVPLDSSVLMDFTPSSQRGRWNSLLSLAGTSFSGSAFIGGLLADSHDYRFTFLITAAILSGAALVYSPLLILVPREEALQRSRRSSLLRESHVNATEPTTAARRASEEEQAVQTAAAAGLRRRSREHT